MTNLQPSDTPTPDVFHVVIDEVPSEAVGPGVERRVLWDSPSHRVTAIDIVPGGSMPYLDVHPTFEGAFVISGTWMEGDRTYKAGDFIHYQPGTSHQPTTPTGGRLVSFRVWTAENPRD